MATAFLMCVEDVFRLRQGRSVMVTGRIERGRVRRGDEVEIVGPGDGVIARVVDIEACHVRVDEARADMNVGVLLPGTAADLVERGHVLAAPGSIRAHACFTADITVLSEEQGGTDLMSGDRLRFHIRTAAVWGTVMLHGVDVVRPLHGAAVAVTLDEAVALEEAQRFTFRRHGRATGSGTVTRLPR
ncbi:EF-Tu/IF-2/RF-3 family GTPase [Streptomyces sp. NPDC127038]|uniref:EF-Tu C-terminal domain-related protein n=1 Tax=Streptomyces sp. NPDC127038 TaxID=3347114 RepID=UPI0036529972